MVVEPQLEQQISIEEGDRYLICSDGLTDMVSDIEIEKILQRKEKVKRGCKNIIKYCISEWWYRQCDSCISRSSARRG